MRRSAALIAAIAAAGVIGSTSGSAAVSAAARSRIKLGTVAPKDSSYHRLLLEMGEQWRNASGGQVELVIYPGGTQGSEADVVKRMSVGELQAGMLSVGGLTEIDPAVSALQEIPMLFQSLAEEEHVINTLRPDLERLLAAKGFVALFWGDSGWARFFTRNAALRPDDFKGLKIFVTASGSAAQMQIMQALGYKPVPLEMADALIQLQTRGVDAVPTLPLMALAGQFHTVTKHMLELNWAPLVGATVVTKSAWDGVPPAMRDELLKIAADTGNRMREASRQENEQAVAVMQAKSGLQVHAVSAALEAEWRQFAEAIYPRLRGSMVPAEMFDRARQRVAEYRAARR